MPRRREEDEEDLEPRSKPAISPEGRENQLINMAYELAEKKLKNGTASSQETTFFLKMGSPREKLERQRLENENAVLRKKVEQMESQMRMEELIGDALSAFRSYSPSQDGPDEVGE